MRNNNIGSIFSPGFAQAASSNNGDDWTTIISDAIKTIPTFFNHGSTVNPYMMSPNSNWLLPGSSNQANQVAPPPQNSSIGLNTTMLLAVGVGGLLLFKMLKKK